MNWSESFRRAIIATLWMVLFFVISGVVVGIGMIMGVSDFLYGDHDYNVGLMIAGLIIAIIGYVGMIFASLAVYLKFITDAVVDNMMKRLYPPTQQPPSQKTQQQ